MEEQYKINEIIDCTIRITKIFMAALEKFQSADLFRNSELLYMHEAFAVWLNEVDKCTGELCRITDEQGLIYESYATTLDELHRKIKATYASAENFSSAFEQLCIKRAQQFTGLKEVQGLFGITVNDK